MKRFLPFCILSFAFLSSYAQTDTNLIYINGRVYDPLTTKPDLNNFMIVDMETQHGFYGKADGSFSIDINKNDTLVIAVIGYDFVKYCFRDSVLKPRYDLLVRLKRKEVQLPEVHIIAPRDLEAIERDIQKLGYNKRDYEISGINALESPITFLYEEFSRFEQLRRRNAQIVNNEKRRNLLKELLSRYVADAIISLSNDEFEHFIDFCDVNESYMKTASQYDFMVYIKRKFDLFEAMNDYYRPGRKIR
ncbi:hypothetical protein BH11BAC1_BH11BAC1_11560 [soil metagenome]